MQTHNTNKSIIHNESMTFRNTAPHTTTRVDILNSNSTHKSSQFKLSVTLLILVV